MSESQRARETGSQGIAGLRRLSIPYPPGLDRTLGYGGNARLVAWWVHEGVLRCEDGRGCAIANMSAWCAFTSHPNVALMLTGYRLEVSDGRPPDGPGPHEWVSRGGDALVTDRRAPGAIYVGDFYKALHAAYHLNGVAGEPDPSIVPTEALAMTIARRDWSNLELPPSQEEAKRLLEEQHRREDFMISFLDHIEPGKQGARDQQEAR